MLFKNIDNIRDDLGELMQRFNDRLVLKGLLVAESYLEGRLEILADFDISCGGETHKYLAVFNRANMHIHHGEQGAKIVSHLEVVDSCIMGRRDKCFMFIGYVEIVDSPQKFIPSVIRFQRADYLDDIFSGSVYVSIFDHTVKAVDIITKRKIDVLGVSAFHAHQFRSEKVKSRSQVMNSVTDDCSKMARYFMPDSKCPELIRGVRVLLDNDSVRFRFNVVDDVIIKLTDVSFGPLNF